jgi:glycine oxidase
MKILIVGAGVSGLATGWRLAQAGCEVEVIERGLAGRGATWAAAGMIAASSESGLDEGPLTKLANDSRRMWPEFARELREASGLDPRLRNDGALLVAFDEAQERRLRATADELRRKALPGQWLSAKDARALEPLLAPDIRGALHATDSFQVDNRALCEALAAALVKAGSKLQEGRLAQMLVFEQGKDQARGLLTDGGIMLADAVVIAGGAWTNWIGGLPRDALPPIRPVKGQMAALVPPNGGPLPKCATCESDIYVVPRRGRVLLGATVEEAGFDTSVTNESQAWLIAGACKLMPSLSRWRVAESWAGLRPAAPDNLPVLGKTNIEGLFVASGQFRNGILFAPMAAEAMRALVLGEAPHAYLTAFSPRRFVRGVN